MKGMLRLLAVVVLVGAGMHLLTARWPDNSPAPADYGRDVRRLDEELVQVKQKLVRTEAAAKEAEAAAQIAEASTALKMQAVEADETAEDAALRKDREQIAKLEADLATVRMLLEQMAKREDVDRLQGQLQQVDAKVDTKASRTLEAVSKSLEAVDSVQKRLEEVEAKAAAPPPPAAPAKPQKPVSVKIPRDRTVYLTGEGCVHCRNMERVDFPLIRDRGVTIGPGRESRLQVVDINSDEGQQYVEDFGLLRSREFGLPYFVRLIDEKPVRQLKGRHSIGTLLEFITQAADAPGADVRPVKPAPINARPPVGNGRKDA